MLLPELSKTGRTLEDLIADLQQPAETLELRFKIKGADYSKTGNQMIQALPAFVAQTAGWQIDPENEEGIRVSLSAPYGSGWFLLRMSLHEPLLVLQVENDFSGIQPKFLQTFASFIADFTAIDNRSLTNKLSWYNLTLSEYARADNNEFFWISLLGWGWHQKQPSDNFLELMQVLKFYNKKPH